MDWLMIDPLAEIITLLRPRCVFAKCITAAGRWSNRYSDLGQPSFSTVLEGSCRLTIDGEAPVTLQAGDFVLIPGSPRFILSGFDPATPRLADPKLMPPSGELRHGKQDGPPDLRLLGGWFAFDSPDAALLVSLLPPLIHVRGADSLSALTSMIGEEARQQRTGRDLVLNRLVEVLLIEALREGAADTSAGLFGGFADARIMAAIRAVHTEPAYGWTVEKLAKIAAMSRSAFFDRFMRVVGMTPMDYLLAWRMALAKDMLRREEVSIEEVAERVGYASASTLCTAFARHVGQSPRRYAREHAIH